jgi:hypothetical protein
MQTERGMERGHYSKRERQPQKEGLQVPSPWEMLGEAGGFLFA